MRASINDQVKEFLINIEENFDPTPECCICRVPKSIRRVNEEAYTPQLISIGPLHHGKEELADMEIQKKRYMNSFRKRTTIEKMEEILAFIINNEQRIRSCYAESSNLGSYEFVLMILYDTIFIIKLFIRNYNRDPRNFFLDIPVMKADLSLDLQLLENQLPYFVLEEICKLAIVSPTFRGLCNNFLSSWGTFDSLTDQTVVIKHITDFIRSALLKTYKSVKPTAMIEDLPSAVKLIESGVKFKGIKGKCLLDIRFEKGIYPFKGDELRIPNLEVNDHTEYLFRNLMALEQCHYPFDARIFSFVHLMDNLINTEKDVDLLVGAEIITNRIGDHASIEKMSNKLCKEIDASNSSYYYICDELKAHYKNPWNHAKATLKSVYFNDLWRGTGTVAAIVLLVLTFIQTICSIMQVA